MAGGLFGWKDFVRNQTVSMDSGRIQGDLARCAGCEGVYRAGLNERIIHLARHRVFRPERHGPEQAQGLILFRETACHGRFRPGQKTIAQRRGVVR